MACTYDADQCRIISEVLTRVGDKWSIVVILKLGDRRHRFNDLKRAVGAISQRMLTLTLRDLERDGLVRRTVLATVPPGVEYELTDLGRTFLTSIHPIAEWAATNLVTIDRARKSFDGAADRPTSGSAPANGWQDTAFAPVASTFSNR